MRPWLAAGLALLLGGCAHVPPADDGLGFEARRAALEAVPAWRMRGRIAIEAGDEGRMARFRWAADGAALALDVRGPFGAGSFRIEGAPPLLTVTARGERWRLEDAEAQLSEWFGWWLPVASLNAWLLGLPDRDYPTASTAYQGDVLAALEQRRWDVRYAQYMLAEGLLVPREIVFRHRDLTIDLTIDEWARAEE